MTKGFLKYLQENILHNNDRKLSQGELELSEFLIKGFTLTDVARARGVAYATIYQQRERIINKLQIPPRFQPKKPKVIPEEPLGNLNKNKSFKEEHNEETDTDSLATPNSFIL